MMQRLSCRIAMVAAAAADPAFAATTSSRPSPNVETVSDIALASCLIRQPDERLRDEGHGLASIAFHRSGQSPLDFDDLRRAVARELKRRPMTTVHVDAPVGRSDRPAYLAHCLAIVRTPSVQAAILSFLVRR